MANHRPLILVTNDDGIEAKGIAALVEVAKRIGDVVVVAPYGPQSGQGHAITLEEPLRLRKHKRNIFEIDEAYSCSGTPVDCVKLARNVLLKDRKIDLCVSGINHGSNASINIIYSGTMSAAMEASLEKINAIGFSLLNYSPDADFSEALVHVEKIIRGFLTTKNDKTQLLNVNIPNILSNNIKGIKICRQGKGKWEEDYKEGIDPRGEKYYWLTGKFIEEDKSEGSDLWALENNYISVVPSYPDLTDYDSFESLNYLEKLK